MSLAFSIISPEGLVAEGEAVMVTAPGVEGEFSVMARHAPFATLLRPGAVIIQTEKERKNYFYLHHGFLRADDKEVVILGNDVKSLNDLDEDRLRRSLKNKLEDLTRSASEEEKGGIRQDMIALQAQLDLIMRVRS